MILCIMYNLQFCFFYCVYQVQSFGQNHIHLQSCRTRSESQGTYITYASVKPNETSPKVRNRYHWPPKWTCVQQILKKKKKTRLARNEYVCVEQEIFTVYNKYQTLIKRYKKHVRFYFPHVTFSTWHHKEDMFSISAVPKISKSRIIITRTYY